MKKVAKEADNFQLLMNWDTTAREAITYPIEIAGECTWEIIDTKSSPRIAVLTSYTCMESFFNFLITFSYRRKSPRRIDAKI
jgi:hypothetical protein